MIDFDIPKQQSSIIKVIGVGGGGGNAVNNMFLQKIENVDFISCNTDAQTLSDNLVPNKILLGPHLTQGLGAGGNPEVGRQATEESLNEVKRILEVNTKMAFVCAGMGGGTGTGGAPIIAKICQDLGILTVGIVTTPFSFEGPKRKAQAQQGISELQPHVDTLLVVSNDKLRRQYKSWKMSKAFAQADNVLSTAAKCITDIINSKGKINVDFADVCTVMRKGGVAILGSAVAEGENRAQTAIENALNSPLLNDNDISGAKWILLNITSGEDDNECSTDEFEFINDYVRQKTGADTDIIVGMGTDNSLEKGLAVTLIATGFARKNPFLEDTKKEIFSLDENEQESKTESNLVENSETEKTENPFVENYFSQPTLFDSAPEITKKNDDNEKEIFSLIENKIEEEKIENPLPDAVSEVEEKSAEEDEQPQTEAPPAFPAKSAKIFVSLPQQVEKINVPAATLPPVEVEDSLKMVFKEEIAEEPSVIVAVPEEDLTEDEINRRKAEERIQKLRSLSFSFSGRHDENDDWENVPAYVRRNLEILNSNTPKENTAENYYSKYTVSKDENNQTNISSINTFLEGKKPD